MYSRPRASPTSRPRPPQRKTPSTCPRRQARSARAEPRTEGASRIEREDGRDPLVLNDRFRLRDHFPPRFERDDNAEVARMVNEVADNLYRVGERPVSGVLVRERDALNDVLLAEPLQAVDRRRRDGV